MPASDQSISIFFLERLCDDLKVRLEAQAPQQIPPTRDWQQLASRGSLLISIVGIALASFVPLHFC